MGYIITKSLVLLLSGALIAALSGCSASPAPASVPGSASQPRTSESPSAAEPAKILIGAETIEVVDAGGGVLVSLRYSEDGDAAVAAMTAVLGAPADTHHQDGTPHTPPMDGTSWGGLDIVVNRYSDELRPTEAERLYLPAFSVQASAKATGGGVAVASVDGSQVGDAFDALAEGKPATEVHLDDVFGVRSVALDVPTSFPGIVDPGVEMAYGVIGWCDKGAGSVAKITAPGYLFSLT